MALASCAGSRFRETNHEFVQSNKCEISQDWTRSDHYLRKSGWEAVARSTKVKAVRVSGTSKADALRKLRAALKDRVAELSAEIDKQEAQIAEIQQALSGEADGKDG